MEIPQGHRRPTWRVKTDYAKKKIHSLVEHLFGRHVDEHDIKRALEGELTELESLIEKRRRIFTRTVRKGS